MITLITGGGNGLGKEILKKVFKLGSERVYFTYANSEKTAKEIEIEFPNATAIHCDFGDKNSIQKLVDLIPTLDIEVLINNAYTEIVKEYFHKSNSDMFLTSFERNVLPVIKITQECIKVFRKKKNGKIINIISSVVVNKPPIGWSSYAANKSYLLSLSKSWAVENIKFNVSSNSVSPAFMLTNLTSDTDSRIVEQMVNEHPLKRLLSTQEVADTVGYLFSASNQINGINLVINAASDIV